MRSRSPCFFGVLQSYVDEIPDGHRHSWRDQWFESAFLQR
jgi:hypothetical protein